MKKLSFQLVPDSCWYSNLRTILSKKQWEFIRQDCLQRYDHKCAICNSKPKRLECHEVWEYDEKNRTQILKDVICVCHKCHQVIHIGRTSLLGDIKKAEEHYLKVNKCSYAEYLHDLGLANQKHKRLNEISEWKLDLTWLSRFIKD